MFRRFGLGLTLIALAACEEIPQEPPGPPAAVEYIGRGWAINQGLGLIRLLP